MREAGFNKTQVVRYLAWAFGLAYAVQFGAAWLYNNGKQQTGQLIVAGMMFVPAMSVLLAGGKLKDMGWKPRVKKNINCS